MVTLSGAYWLGSPGDTIQFGGSGTNSTGFSVDSTSTLILQGGSYLNTQSNASYAISNFGTTKIKDATISSGSSSGVGVINQSGGKFYDECGLTFSGTGTAFSNVGTVFTTCSATGTASATGNWVTTSGWGTTAVTTAVGDSHRTLVTLTNTVAGSAIPVLTWTFPKAYPTVAPVTCLLFLVGGTGTGLTTPFVPGTPSKTSVAFTLGGTPGTGTYIFDANCGP
jgi:hypothetical protein